MENTSGVIINRINALLNKTVENGCTVAEAASAAKIAQLLLTQHRLTVADLSVNGESQEDIHNKGEPLFVGARRVHWKDKLANCLATVNGCKAYVDTIMVQRTGRARRGSQVFCRIIGRDSDIQIVRYFFHYLEREIETLCKEAMGRNEGSGKTWSNSFKNGASDAICSRLREANQEIRDEANNTALVKLDNRDEAVSQWAEDNGLKFKTPPDKNVNFSRHGYVQGKIAGSNVNLNKGITAKNDPKQLN